MGGRLQYIYTIFVFLGVLLTSYLMMSQEGNARIPLQIFQADNFRSQASVANPGLEQLFSIEREYREFDSVSAPNGTFPSVKNRDSQ